MTTLRLGPLSDEKPVKVVIELSASVHRDLAAYANVLAQQSGTPVADPAKLIAPMIQKFMAADRAFAKAKRNAVTSKNS